MTRDESRRAALLRLDGLLALLKQQDAGDGVGALIAEGEGLRRAIEAFHFEAIRFRMFRFDRMLHAAADLPPNAVEAFGQVRADLEAAGFQTGSH